MMKVAAEKVETEEEDQGIGRKGEEKVDNRCMILVALAEEEEDLEEIKAVNVAIKEGVAGAEGV